MPCCADLAEPDAVAPADDRCDGVGVAPASRGDGAGRQATAVLSARRGPAVGDGLRVRSSRRLSFGSFIPPAAFKPPRSGV